MAQKTASPLRKHRLGVQSYLVDFVDELATGELLTGNSSVVITKRDTDGSFADVTSEFSVTEAAHVSGRYASFQLGAATGSQQDAGTDKDPVVYTLLLLHATDASPANSLPSTHALIVSERGDSNAP